MFYSYGNATPGWKSKRKQILATRLSALIEEFTTNETGVSREALPYVKVDPQKDAVSIRWLTSLSDNLIDKLTSQADAVYREVMGLRSSKSGLPQNPIRMS
jgi:hypothetical protein